MRILLDECVDWRLARLLAGHQAQTARQMGWSTVKNGELLALAAADIDAFVTVDRNMALQQGLRQHDVAVLVLRAKRSRLADLRPLVPALLAALPRAKPGEATFAGG